MTATLRPADAVRSKTHIRRGASRHLAKVLREQFTGGQFGPGDRLPTLRQLMERFNVGYSVANRAMEILAAEGLIQRHHGQGSYVSKKASDNRWASRTNTLALVLGYTDWSINLSLCQGSDAAAGQLHYQTIVCETKSDVALQALALMQLIDMRVAGIALVPTIEPETPDFQVRLCQDCGIPVVLLHRAVKGVSAPLIALPFEEIGYGVGQTLVQQGHGRVACVFSERYIGSNQYEAGVRRALAEVRDGPHELSVYCGGKRPIPMSPEHEEFLGQMLENVFAQPAAGRPTAIIALADDDAEWVYMRLMRMGVSVPDEMSLITVGSAIRQREIDRQLSAVTIDEMGVGRLAARLLAEMGKQQRPINDSGRFTAELGFHAGRTLGPAPRR
jgi:GntR family transcriptional regulator, arabinose operon transcriptional repressor